MSRYLAETNGESAFRLFNKRTVYRGILQKKRHNNIVQMDVAEKILYGRIDKTFLPITLAKDKLKIIKNVDNDAVPMRAVNFVVDLFEQMSMQFKKCEQSGKLRSNDPFLSNLKAYKAYDDPLIAYQKYRDNYFNSLAGYLISEDIKIKGFDDMVRTLMPILQQTLKYQPITYAGYLKSKNCSVMSTGLAIEIADMDYINDDEKIKNFVNSPNWEFYVNTCDSYGFMVDLNVPWRIVVDLDSTAAIDAASRYYTVDSVDKTLAYYYVNSSRYTYSFFKKMMLRLYQFIRQEYIEIVVCDDTGAIRQSAVIPETYTYESFVEKYNERYFIELYTKLRIYEEAPDTSADMVTRTVADQLNYFEADPALDRLFMFLESQLNKTFDKEGSMSYHNKGKRKRQIEAFSDGSITNVTITEKNDISSY